MNRVENRTETVKKLFDSLEEANKALVKAIEDESLASRERRSAANRRNELVKALAAEGIVVPEGWNGAKS